MKWTTDNYIKAFIYAFTSLILFVIANSFPFITLDLGGEYNTISILDSVNTLFSNELYILGIIVFLLIVIFPLWYLLAIVWIIYSFKKQIAVNVTKHFLFLMHKISPWNMLEVYLIGVVVTLTKIMQMAGVVFDAGFWVFCLLMFTTLLANYHFDISDTLFRINE